MRTLLNYIDNIYAKIFILLFDQKSSPKSPPASKSSSSSSTGFYSSLGFSAATAVY
jgi:hypothetical protein